MRPKSIEVYTAMLKKAGIAPDGHGERTRETREEHRRRILDRLEIVWILSEPKESA